MKATILIVTEAATDRSAKISEALREFGISTLLLTINFKNGISLLSCFDFTRTVTSEQEAREAIKRCECSNILYFPIGQLELARSVFESRKKYIVDYKDIIQNTHGDQSQLAENLRRLVENADGLIYRDFQAKLHKKIGNYKLPASNLFLPDMAWPTKHLPEFVLSPALGVKSIAFVGNYPSEKIRPERASMGLLHTAKFLISRGFQVSYFPFPHGAYDFSEYVRLQQESAGRFTLHEPQAPFALHKTLQAYGWGAVVHQYRVFPELFGRCWFDDRHLHNSGGSRLWEYVTSGIPLLYMNDRFNRRIFRGEFAGLYFSVAAIDRIEQMSPSEYQSKREAVLTLRNSAAMSNYAGRLVNFLLNV